MITDLERLKKRNEKLKKNLKSLNKWVTWAESHISELTKANEMMENERKTFYWQRDLHINDTNFLKNELILAKQYINKLLEERKS